MKKFLILVLLLGIMVSFSNVVSATSPDAATGDQPKIKEYVNEYIKGQYVRIPEEDFDKILDNKVSAVISSKINALIAFSIGLIGLLSALSFVQSNRNRNILKEQIKSDVIIQSKDAIADIRKYYESQLDNRISDLYDRLEKSISENRIERQKGLDEIQAKIVQAQEQIKKAEEYLINVEYERVCIQVFDKKMTGPEIQRRTMRLLEDADKNKIGHLIPGIVDLLIRIYYVQLEFNEMTELISKYENDYKLMSSSYVNTALVGLNDYTAFNSIQQRNKAIEYLDKSLELTRGYGEAQGLKLVTYIIDFERNQQDKEKKEQALRNVEIVLDEILKSDSHFPAAETLDRLVRDANSRDYKKYVEKLYELFPEKLRELENKSTQDGVEEGETAVR